MMQLLELLWLLKRHVSRQNNIVVLAIIKLHLSEGIS